jgi:hypothetical protein
MKINYQVKITVKKSTTDDIRIETDVKDQYECFKVQDHLTPWSKWWEMNDHSDLRLWQKDIMRDFATRWPDLTPYVIYKKNHGYSQPHDIAMAYSESKNIWIFITERDFWLTPSNKFPVHFEKTKSMGSILDPVVRKEIYQVIDAIRL